MQGDVHRRCINPGDAASSTNGGFTRLSRMRGLVVAAVVSPKLLSEFDQLISVFD